MYAWMLLCASLAACDTTPVEIRDRGVPQYDGRFLYRWQKSAPEGRWSGLELHLGLARGDETQDLGPGDVVALGGRSLFGPDTLDIDYELRRASLGLLLGRQTEAISAYGIIGAGWQEVEVDVSSGAQDAHGSEEWTGVLGGLGFQWTPFAVLGLESRAALTTDLVSDSTELELAVVLLPRSTMSLALGWRWLEVHTVVESESDVDLELDGPLLGLRVSL